LKQVEQDVRRIARVGGPQPHLAAAILFDHGKTRGQRMRRPLADQRNPQFASGDCPRHARELHVGPVETRVCSYEQISGGAVGGEQPLAEQGPVEHPTHRSVQAQFAAERSGAHAPPDEYEGMFDQIFPDAPQIDQRFDAHAHQMISGTHS